MMNAIYPYWMACRMLRPDDGAGDGGGESKPLSFDDHLKANPEHQAELDRRITKALNTAKAKWEQEAADKMAAEKSEAEKMARMNAEQKAEHERQKREAELKKREDALSLREMRAEASATLAEKGLPLSLLSALDYSNAENCKASIEAVEKDFRSAVQTGVESRLKGNTPKGGGAANDAQLEKMRKAMGL